MQIGDLSRSRHAYEGHDNPALQALRVLLVVGLMTGGSLALWLSAGTGVPAGGMVTVAPPHLVKLPQRNERVQVADADPSTMGASGLAVEASYLPASGPEDPVPASPTADLSPLAGGQVSAAPASPSLTDVDMTGTVVRQASLAEPARPDSPAADLVDLNRAPVEQLNSLRGAGALGRAIVKGRPYKSVDDLMRKKVLRRPVFERIKDQVTVQ
jgi:hypothetical protein